MSAAAAASEFMEHPPAFGLDRCRSERYTSATATETKSAQLLVRIQPSPKAAAEKAAADDRRSLSSLVEKLPAYDLRRNGYLKGTAR